MEDHFQDTPSPTLTEVAPPPPKTGNLFLDLSFEGKSHPLLYLITSVLSFLIWLLLGSIPLVGVLILMKAIDPKAFDAFFVDSSNFSILPFPFVVTFSAIMLQFVIGILGLWLLVRGFHRRPFRTSITGFSKFRLRRYFAVAGISFLMLALFNLGFAFVSPDHFQPTIGLQNWLIFLPFALLLLPFQTAFEEFFFRGLLLQWFHRMVPSFPLLGVFVSSLLFALMHSFNPEVGHFGFFTAMSSYLTMGLVLALLGVIDEGLEMPSALHFANNLFSFAILGYEGMVLPSPCLFILKEPFPALDVLTTVLFGLILLLLFCRKKGFQWKVLLRGHRALNH